MLRGNFPAKVDDKGRLKIPSGFRRQIEELYGRECFLTSLDGEFARLYPMPIWIDIEKKVASLPTMNPTVTRFLNLVNYFGQATAMDEQGRVLVHPLLRQSSEIKGEVAVLGQQTYLDIWNREKFASMLAANPLTEEDRQILASLGI